LNYYTFFKRKIAKFQLAHTHELRRVSSFVAVEVLEWIIVCLRYGGDPVTAGSSLG